MHAILDLFGHNTLLLFRDTTGTHQEAHFHEYSCTHERYTLQLTYISSRVWSLWLRGWPQKIEWFYCLNCEVVDVNHFSLT